MVVLYYQNHAPSLHAIEFQSSYFIFTYASVIATPYWIDH